MTTVRKMHTCQSGHQDINMRDLQGDLGTRITYLGMDLLQVDDTMHRDSQYNSLVSKLTL